jgi:hypothetical protein
MTNPKSFQTRAVEALTSYQAKCSQYAWLHKEECAMYKVRNKIINITNITITSITATITVITATFTIRSRLASDIITVSTAILLYMTAFISGLQHFLDYEKNAENHRTASLRFTNMSNNIKRTLVLDIENAQTLVDYFKWASSEYENIISSSPELFPSSLQKFEKKFGIEIELQSKIDLTTADTSFDTTVDISKEISNENRIKYEMDRFLNF